MIARKAPPIVRKPWQPWYSVSGQPKKLRIRQHRATGERVPADVFHQWLFL
jgi:hypothetical protein